jgi:hypothetical protein
VLRVLDRSRPGDFTFTIRVEERLPIRDTPPCRRDPLFTGSIAASSGRGSGAADAVGNARAAPEEVLS